MFGEDEGDAVLIARLARELHCYVPERLEGAWAELREEGRRRAQLITNATAAKQLLRDKLGLVAPALLEAACEPFDSATWLASLEVFLERCGGDVARVAALGYEAFARGRLPCCTTGVASGWAGPAGSCSRRWVMTGGWRGCGARRCAGPAARWRT